MNQQKLHGEDNYLPLNVLKLDTTTSYPETNDCIPLINKMTYEKRVENAVKHVFDKLLLCRNSDVATLLAKQYHMDCVLVDGDLVSRKGALTGGYVDLR
jgi:structural maintenance of chromosome 3 (chondroitin sulfate proteoglycan 6)